MTQEAFDLNFRPDSYFRPQALEDFRLAQVKNSQVRAHLRRLLASERHDEVARILREEGVSDDDCRALERIHPLYMLDEGRFEPFVSRIHQKLKRMARTGSALEIRRSPPGAMPGGRSLQPVPVVRLASRTASRQSPGR